MKAAIKKFKPESKYSLKLMLLWVVVFAAIGTTTLLLTRAATPGIPVTVDSSLPNPTNVKAYADDQTATVTWDPPASAGSKGIVGYYVTWGSGSTFTNAKQTIYTITQVQPLTNNTTYTVKVQSVQGSINTVQTGHPDGPNKFAVANGKVSTGATATVTPSSARVDQLRSQMTGFFDDFNTPAGVFDESKWNIATSFCVAKGKGGGFINNQFHSHTQVTSNCDRAQVIERPRATFDITGRTEADPGVIVGDFDGVSQPRDFWYIDLVPLDSRTNNVPLDITSHASAFDDEQSDPAMIRFAQLYDKAQLMLNNADKTPGSPGGMGSTSFQWASGPGGSSPLPEVPIVSNSGRLPVANVRYHWRWEVSPTRLKAFVNGLKVVDSPMPSYFANVKKWTIHSNLFSYNTGKQFSLVHPTASMLHWDNFGFNGPAPTTVVHNYQDGGSNGTTPYLGVGGAGGAGLGKTRKIKIPDPIGTPVSARLKYTLGSTAYDTWGWNSSDNITVNGQKYNVPDPAKSQKAPVLKGWFGYAYSYTNWSDSIELNPSHLVQGDNTITLNLPIEAINVHIELEYPKGSAPAYTPPKDIFGASTMLSLFQPTLSSNDSYLFIEQDMGLPSGAIDSSTPIPDPPTSGDTTKPTISLTAPASNTSVTAGQSFTASANASDNVGVTKVEFYIGNILKATDTSSPFSASLSTAGLTPGSYHVDAVAYDAAGNTATSTSIPITIPEPPDTTKPQTNITLPATNTVLTGSNVSIQALASDDKGVTKVEFYIDGSLISTDTTDPYAATLDSTKLSNAIHTLTTKAYDLAGNSGTSAGVSVTINNTVADTTLPTVAISAPAANATISGTLAFVQATASDNVGVTKVEFYIDGALLGTDTSSPYSFSLNTTLYTNGTHTLSAKAFDSSNNTKTSANVNVTVNNIAADTTPPSVIITAPLSNSTISGSAYAVNVTAADSNSVSKVEFSVDGVLKATDTVAPYAYALDTTTLSNASHAISARAYDPAGNNQAATVAIIVNNTVTPPVAKACDFNADNHVDLKDLIILLGNYGRSVTAGKNGDCTNDGKVDLKDLILLLGAYGS